MTITLRFDLHRDSVLTANQRLHWARKARATAYLRQLGRHHARAFVVTEHLRLDRAHALVELTFPDPGRRRDAGNWHPTAKALIDGIVDSELLAEDDRKHLDGPDLRIVDDRCKPGHVEVAIHLTAVTS